MEWTYWCKFEQDLFGLPWFSIEFPVIVRHSKYNSLTINIIIIGI